MYGNIEVICGPMFAGKTEELLRRVRRLEYAKKKVVLFKPQIDDRYEKAYIVSHNHNKAMCVAIKSAYEMPEFVKEDTDAVVIDEFQFLEKDAPKIVQMFARQGKRVILSGLDKDFRGEPFNNMPEILALADSITKLTAICMKCGKDATCTQRLVNGKPAKYNDPQILVGATESYEARCQNCHEVPGKDE
ncbi:MAG: thymidine kinase [Gammaproteobacteria bacterium]|nr:thymidine kinase [Gammaproteobacteria bacterium]